MVLGKTILEREQSIEINYLDPIGGFYGNDRTGEEVDRARITFGHV